MIMTDDDLVHHSPPPPNDYLNMKIHVSPAGSHEHNIATFSCFVDIFLTCFLPEDWRGLQTNKQEPLHRVPAWIRGCP